ncbi:MAG: 4-hydroxyphenylacetate 3-hydroxylase N-terminal domain-containing protein [Nitrososphaerota archaeon]|nr:4-hydroxyphenylacetate 3-hydroxylase N-terminal domain-containing protein [Nitrososphaerota archaeon]
MGLRTGREYLQSLKDGRELYIGNELIKDPATHEALRYTAQSVARCYDLQLAHADEATFVENGERFSNIWLPVRTKSDFEKVRKGVTLWHRATAGMFGRLHDYLTIWVTALYMLNDVLSKPDQKFGKNMIEYYYYTRSRDLALTHAISMPQIDRSPGAGRKQNEDLHIVDVNEKGVVIEGCRTVSTYAPFANEFITLPQLPANPDEDPDYVIGFALPMNAKNLTFLCRETYSSPDAPWDHPLSTLYDDMDAQAVFDRVMIPWERIFIFRDPKVNFEIYDPIMAYATWQATIRAIVKLEFLIGLALKWAEMLGIDAYPNVQERIGWLIEWRNVLSAAVEGVEMTARSHNGFLIPDVWKTWPLVMVHGTYIYPMAVETLRVLTGSGVIMNPPMSVFKDDRLRKYARKYFRAKGASAFDRLLISKFIHDITVGSLGGRLLQYERYFAADPFRVAIVHYRFSDKSKFKELVDDQASFVKSLMRDAGIKEED